MAYLISLMRHLFYVNELYALEAVFLFIHIFLKKKFEFLGLFYLFHDFLLSFFFAHGYTSRFNVTSFIVRLDCNMTKNYYYYYYKKRDLYLNGNNQKMRFSGLPENLIIWWLITSVLPKSCLFILICVKKSIGLALGQKPKKSILMLLHFQHDASILNAFDL